MTCTTFRRADHRPAAFQSTMVTKSNHPAQVGASGLDQIGIEITAKDRWQDLEETLAVLSARARRLRNYSYRRWLRSPCSSFWSGSHGLG